MRDHWAEAKGVFPLGCMNYALISIRPHLKEAFRLWVLILFKPLRPSFKPLTNSLALALAMLGRSNSLASGSRRIRDCSSETSDI